MSGIPLVLGAAQFGQAYGNGPDRRAPSDADAARILADAAEEGVMEVDTARAYGESEAVLGRVRRSSPSLRVVTKIAPLGPDGTGDEVRASLTASLAALRTDRVDTVLLHRAEDLVRPRALDALREATAAGTAGRWGVSLSTPTELLAALAIPDLSYVQLPVNLLDRRWLTADVQAALADRTDVTIAARTVLLQGLLVGSDPGRWPQLPGIDPAALITALRTLAADLGRPSTLDLAIGYVVGLPWVDAVVLGLRRPDQLPPLIRAVRHPLTGDQLRLVQERLPAGSDRLLTPSRWPTDLDKD